MEIGEFLVLAPFPRSAAAHPPAIPASVWA
jgi:hypothetical protein